MVYQLKLFVLLICISSSLAYLQFPGRCFEAKSYGFSSGSKFEIYANDNLVTYQPNFKNQHRGICVLQTNPDGSLLYQSCFDTCGYSSESDRLRDYLKDLPPNTLVIFAASDDATYSLKRDCTDEIKKFGLPSNWTFDENNFRGSLAIIGFKGSKPGTAIYDQKKYWESKSEIKYCIQSECEGNNKFKVAQLYDQTINNQNNGICIQVKNLNGDDLYQDCYNINQSLKESDRLKSYLSGLPNDTLVAFNSPTSLLQDDLIKEMKKFGFPISWSFDQQQTRFVAIGFKGSKPGSANVQQLVGYGRIEVSYCLNPCALNLEATSIGFSQGNRFEIQVNGVPATFQPNYTNNRYRGICMLEVSLDGNTYKESCYDTYAYQSESDKLRDVLKNLPVGSIVAFTAVDEASSSLKDDCKQEMLKFGLPSDWSFDSSNMWRGSLAVVGIKGKQPNSAVYDQKPDGQAFSQVGFCLNKTLYTNCYESISDGNGFQIKANNNPISFKAGVETLSNTLRGICIYVFDNIRGYKHLKQCFDTHSLPTESDRLRDELESLPPKLYTVIFAVNEEATKNLKNDCIEKMRQFGFPSDWSFSNSQYNGGTLAAIGEKNGNVLYQQKPKGQGTSQVKKCFDGQFVRL